LGFDSITKINLILELEKELNIKLLDCFMVEVVFCKGDYRKIEKLTFKETMDFETDRNIEDLMLKPPEIKDLKQIKNRNSIFNCLKEYMVYLIVKLLAKSGFFIDIFGIELIEKEHKPFLLAPNHSSYFRLFIDFVSFSIQN
jgi:hypothetical protein